MSGLESSTNPFQSPHFHHYPIDNRWVLLCRRSTYPIYNRQTTDTLAERYRSRTIRTTLDTKEEQPLNFRYTLQHQRICIGRPLSRLNIDFIELFAATPPPEIRSLVQWGLKGGFWMTRCITGDTPISYILDFERKFESVMQLCDFD